MPAKYTQDQFVAAFWARVKKAGPDECWEWIGARTHRGYGHLRWGRKTTFAHRVAFHLTNGVDPAKKFVCHVCDNPPCCNPSHLWLGTNSDNLRDCVQKGRHSGLLFVKSNPATKLDLAQVRAAKERLARGESQAAIARDLGVKRNAIWNIARGHHWKHV